MLLESAVLTIWLLLPLPQNVPPIYPRPNVVKEYSLQPSPEACVAEAKRQIMQWQLDPMSQNVDIVAQCDHFNGGPIVMTKDSWSAPKAKK